MTTKKVTKKVAPKKPAAKKSKKEITMLVRVPAELAFWAIDGQSFHTLVELADGLREMEGRVYRYHADKDHQDFAAWVGSVFQNKVAAKALKNAATQKAAEKIIRVVVASDKA